MKTINKNNYEAFLLDYVEENLSPELIAELMLFLEKNPELQEQLDEYEGIKLVAPAIYLEDKNKLKKDISIITINNYEDFIIQEIEGNNTIESSTALHLFLEKNPNKQLVYLAYQKTKLIAPTIIFKDKKSLKKKEGIVIPMYWWYSSAAAVIIIIFLLNGFNNGKKNKVQTVANNIEIIASIKNDTNIKEARTEEKKEKNNLASVKIEKSVSHKKKKVKVIIPHIIPEIKEEPANVFVENHDEKIDSIRDTLPNNIEEQAIEEIKYADNVKITFEDDSIPQQVEKSESKVKILTRALLKSITKKFLKQEKNEEGEVLAYTVNIGKIGFSRKKRLKK